MIQSPRIIERVFPSICWKKKTIKKDLYLTFDDSPSPRFTYWLLNLLSSLSIQATFFCIGKKSEKYPQIISKIIDEGHQIGNHSYSHKNGFLSTTISYLEDIEKCRNVLPPTSLFRPPYGNIYPWQIRKISKNYQIIMWDVLSYDYKKNITPKKLKWNVLSKLQNGSIIVFHDNKESEKILKTCLKEILCDLKKRGFKFKLLCSNAEKI